RVSRSSHGSRLPQTGRIDTLALAIGERSSMCGENRPNGEENNVSVPSAAFCFKSCPDRSIWTEHFELRDGQIIGLTARRTNHGSPFPNSWKMKSSNSAMSL